MAVLARGERQAIHDSGGEPMNQQHRGPGVGHIDRRTVLRGSLAAALACVVAACSSGGSASSGSTAAAGLKAEKDGSTLDLFAWQGYFAPSTISGFEKKYGITVKQTYITSADSG